MRGERVLVVFIACTVVIAVGVFLLLDQGRAIKDRISRDRAAVGWALLSVRSVPVPHGADEVDHIVTGITDDLIGPPYRAVTYSMPDGVDVGAVGSYYDGVLPPGANHGDWEWCGEIGSSAADSTYSWVADNAVLELSFYENPSESGNPYVAAGRVVISVDRRVLPDRGTAYAACRFVAAAAP